MSKPAARIGDMTAHGGVITVGQPTVLIGGMPAARATDMHTCPMFNGPQPHVGGPISMGSSGVLIGGMPAARMGDMATCAGPPDPIVMGCFTVLIGEVSGGGAGGGGGGGGAGAAGASASAATAQFADKEPTILEEHWVEFKFVDKAGLPVSGPPYRFEDPNGAVDEGRLRLDGTVRRDGLKEGTATVVVHDVWAAAWSQSEAQVGDSLTLTAKVEGFESGTPATVQVFERDIRGADAILDEIPATTQGTKVEVDWVFWYDEPVAGEPAADLEAFGRPQYYFEVRVGPATARSGILELKDSVEIIARDADGSPLGGEPYVLVFSDGSVRKGTLDGDGFAEEKNVPPASWKVSFPDVADARLTTPAAES